MKKLHFFSALLTTMLVALTSQVAHSKEDIFSKKFIQIEMREALTQEQCGQTLDLSSHFGPVRDQGGLGLCWSFGAAALLEEQLCLMNPETCGKIQLSALHTSSSTWSLGDKKQGRHMNDALDGILGGNGVCEEDQAPYPSYVSAGCSLLNRDGADCMVRNLEREYTHWHGLALNNPDSIDTQKLKEILGLNFEEDVAISALARDDKSQFLQDVLIPMSCQAQAHTPSEFGAVKASVHETLTWTHDPSDEHMMLPREIYTWPEKLEKIKSVLNTNHSVGISFCSTSFLSKKDPKRYLLANYEADCGPHAVVVVGSRWSEEKARCELAVRNSWGVNTSLQGWVSAEKLLSTIYRVTYLENIQ